MHNMAEKIWQSAQEHLRAKLNPDMYNMWFAPLRAHAMDNHQFTLEAPNEFSEVWLKDNYLSLIQDAVAVAAGFKLPVKFRSANPMGTTPVPPKPVAHAPKPKLAEPPAERIVSNGDLHFNPKNTFDTFVVGNN